VIFTATPVPGVVIVDLERREDDRGFFARAWCREEFAAAGLDPTLEQASISWNRLRGTLRGLHWQAAPHQEAKLIRCVRGALYDVAVDLRPGSPCYREHVAVELSADNHRALYIPAGCAHGFQTLTDDTEIFYQMSASYAPAAQRGARWDDPAFGIEWPIDPPLVHPRDSAFPDFAR
jgi:dTDP-4-dehydrorhamnose 3,5-epimerase